MRVYGTREFSRFASKEKLNDRQLCEAVGRAERGLVDANLAGPLIKQRIPREGQGRSSGYRAIIVYRSGDLAIFVAGFAKSSRANFSKGEQALYREFGEAAVELSQEQLDALVAQRGWRKLDCEGNQDEVSE